MIVAQARAETNNLLGEDLIRQTFFDGLAGQFGRQKVLVLIPDGTRTLPLPFLFRLLVEILHDTQKLDFMVALGTHPPLNKSQLRKLVGISTDEYHTTFKHIGLLNHTWQSDEDLLQIGILTQAQIKTIVGDL